MFWFFKSFPICIYNEFLISYSFRKFVAAPKQTHKSRIIITTFVKNFVSVFNTLSCWVLPVSSYRTFDSVHWSRSFAVMVTVTSLIVKSYGSASAYTFEHVHITRRDKGIFVNSEINAIKAYHPRLYVRNERRINVRTTETD